MPIIFSCSCNFDDNYTKLNTFSNCIFNVTSPDDNTNSFVFYDNFIAWYELYSYGYDWD